MAAKQPQDVRLPELGDFAAEKIHLDKVTKIFCTLAPIFLHIIFSINFVLKKIRKFSSRKCAKIFYHEVWQWEISLTQKSFLLRSHRIVATLTPNQCQLTANVANGRQKSLPTIVDSNYTPQCPVSEFDRCFSLSKFSPPSAPNTFIAVLLIWHTDMRWCGLAMPRVGRGV